LKLGDAKESFFYIHVHFTGKRQNAVAGNSFKNGACCSWCSDQLVVNHKHHVHGATLLNKLMGFTVRPQQLIITLPLCYQCRVEGTCVISCSYCRPCTPFNRPPVIGFHFYRNRFSIVMTYRTRKNHKLILRRKPNTQIVLSGKNKMPEV